MLVDAYGETNGGGRVAGSETKRTKGNEKCLTEIMVDSDQKRARIQSATYITAVRIGITNKYVPHRILQRNESRTHGM